MLKDDDIRKGQEEVTLKQHQITKENLRQNKIKIQNDKMKKSPHNQRYMDTLLKLKYHLEDSYECYDFLG